MIGQLFKMRLYVPHDQLYGEQGAVAQ